VPENLKTAELCFEAVRGEWGEGDCGMLKYVPKELRTVELCYEAAKGGKEWVLKYAPNAVRREVLKLMSKEREKMTFKDPRDGKIYRTVKIGEQIWMAENLDYEEEGSVCYDNDPANGEKYGRLYDWDTAMRACPPGWHLPSREEWEALAVAVGESEPFTLQGGMAIPIMYGKNHDYKFGNAGKRGYWWSSSELDYLATVRIMQTSFPTSFTDDRKIFLFSVRCVKDKEKDGYADTDEEWITPEEFKNAEFCKERVEFDGTSLKYVPENLKTAELCMAAVKNNGNAIEYVPEHLKTAELCMVAVKQELSWDTALQYVPEHLKTAELCFIAVVNWGPSLEYVPEKFKTRELCKEAVRKCAPALWFVPEEFKTVDFCMEAIDKNMDWEFEHNDVLEYALKALPEAVREEVLKRMFEATGGGV